MNRSTAGRLVLFVILATGLTAAWWYVEKNFIPKKEEPAPKAAEPPKPTRETIMALAGGIASPTDPATQWISFYLPEKPKEDPAKRDPVQG